MARRSAGPLLACLALLAGAAAPPALQESELAPLRTAAQIDERVGVAQQAAAAGDAGRARELLNVVVTVVLDPAADLSDDEREPRLEGLALLAWRWGDYPLAGRCWEWLVAFHERGEEHGSALRAARTNLAMVWAQTGRPSEAAVLGERIVAALEEAGEGASLDACVARHNLAAALTSLGEYERSAALFERVLTDLSELVSPTHVRVLNAHQALAATCLSLGRLSDARRHAEEALRIVDTDPAADPVATLPLRLTLASILGRERRLVDARGVLDDLLATAHGALPEDHTVVLSARMNRASLARELGDLEQARADLEQVVAAWERRLEPGHRNLVAARSSLAAVLEDLGELPRAKASYEELLDEESARFPPGHPHLLVLWEHYGSLLSKIGDPRAPALLEENVLPFLEPGGADYWKARYHRAAALFRTGDPSGALAALGDVEEGLREAYGPADEAVLAARHLRISAHERQGQIAAALQAAQGLLAAREELTPADHEGIEITRMLLAMLHKRAGSFGEALALEERSLAVLSAALSPDHPTVRTAEVNLALSHAEVGDPGRAAELVGGVWREWSRRLPAGHSMRLQAREVQARIAERTGEGITEHAAGLAQELWAWVRRAEHLPRRQLQESYGLAITCLDRLASLALAGEPGAVPRLFELEETLRAAASSSSWLASADAATEELFGRLAAARRRVHALGLATLGPDEQVRPSADLLLRAVRERDRLESLLVERARGLAPAPPVLSADDVARALPRDSAVVAFRAVEARRRPGVNETRLHASVLAPGRELVRLDLGPLDAIRAASAAWRAELEGEGGRGLGVERPGPEASTDEAARRVHELLIEPVLDAVGEIATLHVCADDVLHLLPLEALPHGEGVLGDRVRVRNEVSLERIVRPAAAPGGPPRLLLVGGVDFGSGVLAASAAEERLGPLPGTAREVERIAALHAAAFGGEGCDELGGPSATRTAFLGAAVGARFLHVATHGVFLGAPAGAPPGAGYADLVERMAPTTRTGLVLAPDAGGTSRSPALVTAEELAGTDLRACELAVLSACDTSLGVDADVGGLHSLRTALHSAGVRASITSLWKVDDLATQALMERFYAALWGRGLSKAEALWAARCELREEGRPPRDWAGWILTGDPR